MASIASRFLLGLSADAIPHTQWRRLIPGFLINGLYGPAMQPLLGTDPTRRYARAFDTANGSTFDKSLIADQSFHLPALLWKADAMSMAASVEMRVPFLDRRIVEFAGRCSRGLLTPLAGRSKRILRISARRLGAPGELVRASKRGFNSPIARWLRGALRDTAELHLNADAHLLEPWLQPQTVRQLWCDHRDGIANYAYALWPILHFARWQYHLQSR